MPLYTLVIRQHEVSTAINALDRFMRKQNKFIRSETIDGFSITYETEQGRTFAFGYCPICGNKEESAQLGLDAGRITASKLRAHINMVHKKADAPSPKVAALEPKPSP